MKPLVPTLLSILLAGSSCLPLIGLAQSGDSGIWLPTLETATPQEGFELAVKLSRMGVKTTQPDVEVLKKAVGLNCAKDPDDIDEGGPR
ncbi:MAG: hexameric tyrosine-coordinated heme protein [Gammaproteobacteria bacterium]|nr:hexameric tyrosine-coordinated heme protein [Gammaproteobacteria bacterium]